ncbi:tetratricopeptide repeat protein [Actinoplanes sp. NPDC048796]|uniref:ATP-binding protein n=1 Tax=Actinoplanes sp. NPDC048796 TaxID=3155640 RepID=UPI0033ECE194
MPADRFATLPDPGQATTLDEFAAALRLLKAWAGNPSYETITGRVNAGRPAARTVGKTTVVDCFRPGRRRLDDELVVAVVEALHGDAGYVTQWRHALRVISGESRAAAQVRVQDTLPDDLPGFTGRAAEADRLAAAVRDGSAVMISGMAGVGKTRLAVHAAHRLGAFDHVLFVNLRGFHPDQAQPPADPSAVLDAFLRLLGVPGQQLPHDLGARAAAYRKKVWGTRTLVVLDDAASEEQVRPLLPEAEGCVALVTSRRSFPGLATVDVGVFTPGEALAFLARDVPGVPAGTDPRAADRIAARCGHLPLALALVAGHMRAKPGWTLTDHADWLDERHRAGRLDSGVQFALDVSYRNLPADTRDLLRLVAQHPGQDFDVSAAAALAGCSVPDAAARLGELAAHHLVQQSTGGRFTLHDLIRSYAVGRAADEDRRADRRAALTRLFDLYLAAAAATMNRLDPVEAHRRPAIDAPATPLPEVTDPLRWLAAERANLIAVTAYTATEGWPSHTTRLAAVLFRYLMGGYHAEALVVHGHARDAARTSGDAHGHARALAHLAVAEVQLGRHEEAAAHLEQSLQLFRHAGDGVDQARTLNNLGVAETRLGRYERAAGRHREALSLYEQAGDRTGQARALVNVANLESRTGDPAVAAGQYSAALALYKATGDELGACGALSNLGEVETLLNRHDDAVAHVGEALSIARRLGNRSLEAWALDSLGTAHRSRGDVEKATASHRAALQIFTETSDVDGQAWAHNGLGEDAHQAGDHPEAIAAHTRAHEAAVTAADRQQQARALTGLADCLWATDNRDEARKHYYEARALWIVLRSPEANRITARLDTETNLSGRQTH